MTSTVVQTAAEETPSITFKTQMGQYKEVGFGAPHLYQEETERNGSDKHAPATYPNYLPVWDFDTKYPPLTPFTHTDPGKSADPTFPHLLPSTVRTTPITGNMGLEIHGIQLSALSTEAKNELALLAAQKKVLVFRDQDLASHPIPTALALGAHFGRHHIHPTSGAPRGHPEIHLVHRSADDSSAADLFAERTNSVTWHSDVTYEAQPPGTTFLYVLDGPEAGGDTLFADMVGAYGRLSEGFRKRLHGLKVVHSATEQADASRARGGVVRRDPVSSLHPLIRTHPVTGEKALFVNAQFSRRIAGYKKEESDFLLNFLYDHVAKGQDFQARVKWAPGTVVVWDNRVTAHTALFDWEDGARRHLARLTPQAERPFETPFGEGAGGGAAGFEY